MKESSIRMDTRRFSEPVDEIAGTVESATPAGIKLREYPGRIFRFSSVGTTRCFRPAGNKNPRARACEAGASPRPLGHALHELRFAVCVWLFALHVAMSSRRRFTNAAQIAHEMIAG